MINFIEHLTSKYSVNLYQLEYKNGEIEAQS